MKNLGIVLVAIGIIMMIITGFNFVTREKVVDLGPVQITSNKNNPIEWSPILGGAILVAGIAVIAANRKKN